MTKHCTLCVLRAHGEHTSQPRHLPGSSRPPWDRPWHLPYNDQVHLLPEKRCWLSLHDLRAASNLKFQMEGALGVAGSVLSAVFSSSSGEPEPCSVPQEWAVVGAVLWAWAGAREREICRLDFELVIWFEFLPPKNLFFKKIASFSLALSSRNLTINERFADSCNIYNSNSNVSHLVCSKHLLVLLLFRDTELLYAERILRILGSRGSWACALLCLRPQQRWCFSVFSLLRKVWYN